jgi:hypothetical protein
VENSTWHAQRFGNGRPALRGTIRLAPHNETGTDGENMSSARNIRKLATTTSGAGALLLAGLTLTGCSVLNSLVEPEPVRDETGEVVEGVRATSSP